MSTVAAASSNIPPLSASHSIYMSSPVLPPSIARSLSRHHQVLRPAKASVLTILSYSPGQPILPSRHPARHPIRVTPSLSDASCPETNPAPASLFSFPLAGLPAPGDYLFVRSFAHSPPYGSPPSGHSLASSCVVPINPPYVHGLATTASLLLCWKI